MRPDRRVFTSRVARRTFVLFVSCALLPVSAISILAFRQVTSELYDQSERQLHQTSKAVALVLLGRLQAADAALPAIAGPRDQPQDGALTRPFLGVLAAGGAEGPDRLVYGRLEEPPALTLAQRARLATGASVLSTESDADGSLRFFLSRPLDRAHPERGILLSALDPAYLWSVQEEAGLPPGVKMLVLDESGRLLFSSFGRAHRPPDFVVQEARRRTTGHFEWEDGATQYRATQWSLFLQSAFSVPRWTILLNQPQGDVLAPIAHFERTFLLVLLLTVLMVLLLSVRQIRKSLIPLERLQEGTRRLAMGDLDTRVTVSSRDEFEELAQSFNRMAGQLGRQFDAVEMRREVGAILGADRELDEILRGCAEILTHRLDLAAVGIWTVEAKEAALKLRASAEPARAGRDARIPMAEIDLGWLVLERKSHSTNSALEDGRLGSPEWLSRGGLVAFAAQPLLAGDRLVGAVAAFARRPLEATELTAFGAAVGDVARHVDRRRVEAALHESEEQTRQLQKMEAVGQLAGGIAHDFNNLLTVILGRSRLMLDDLPADDPHIRAIKNIDETAQRAALLTRQLLAFSRKQVLAPSILDVNEVVGGMTEILQRLIGEQIELVFKPGRGVGLIKVDRGQIEQVIVNLVVNARDAMPTGGHITIETSKGETDRTRTPDEADAPAGPEVRLSVTDTGTGMDAQTKSRIFEPFFTTKEPGKGTGLGLATVFGIVRQSGGRIEVDSAPGAGSTFTIFLPRVEGAVPATEATAAPAGRGGETMLVVEDEDEVRALVQAILAERGYLVLSAGRPSEAIELVEHHRSPIHLLVTDMVMPEMGGSELARRLTALRPEMAALYMSGYAELGADTGPGAPARPTPLLQKPFTPDTLARAVRSALDARPREPAPAAR